MRDLLKKDEAAPRLLSEATSKQVVADVKAFCGTEGVLDIMVQSWWNSGQRWARNRASLTSDQRDVEVMIMRQLRGAQVRVYLNQVDTESLRGASALVNYYAENNARNQGDDLVLQVPRWPTSSGIDVWSEKTFAHTETESGRVVHTLTQQAEAQGFLSAGYIAANAAYAVTYERDDFGRETHKSGRATQAQCSATVRHPKGTGSGWAGQASFDLHRVDFTNIATVAFDKCLKSIDPVRLEPGRYQTILEPQAVEPFVDAVMRQLRRRFAERQNPHPFKLGYDQAVGRVRSKLGLQVLDRRLSLFHNPMDPLSGTHREDGVNEVCWVKDGILTTMWDDYDYALAELDSPNPIRNRRSFVLSGTATTTMDEMIRTMKRGLLVTRVSAVEGIDQTSLLHTGFTRDGLWLVENGKITKAVRNFRWTESPLFIFNNVEEIGPTVPTFIRYPNRGSFSMRNFQNALTAHMVPALKVNDFSFTSTIDAI